MALDDLGWWAAASCNQLVWGLQPVLTRWLQRRAGVDSMSLVLFALCTSFTCNAALTAWNAADQPTEPVKPKANAMPPGKSTDTQSGLTRRQLAFAVAAAYAARASSNFASAGLAPAYIIGMIQLCGVFVMSVGSWCILGETVPPVLWLALLVSVGGGALVVTDHSDDDTGCSDCKSSLLIGLVMQSGSLIFSTASRLLMKMSDGKLNSLEFMRCQYGGATAFALLWLICSGDGVEFVRPWLAFKLADWAAFVALAVGVHFGAATAQVTFNRKLGVAQYALLQPLRIASASFGSALLLAEPITGLHTFVGLSVVASTVLAYACYKSNRKN